MIKLLRTSDSLLPHRPDRVGAVSGKKLSCRPVAKIPISPLEAVDELPRIPRTGPTALPVGREPNEKSAAFASSKVADAILSTMHPGRKSSPTVFFVE